MDALTAFWNSALGNAFVAYFFPMLLTVVTAIAYKGTVSLEKLSSAWVDAKHLSALNAAIETGVTNALAGNQPPSTAMQSTSDYIKASVPGAIMALNASESVLASKINAAIVQKIGLAK